MESAHRAVGIMRQLQNRIPQLQVGDLHASGNRVLKIILETEVAFVKRHGPRKVPDVECQVIDAHEHCRLPASRDEQVMRRAASWYHPDRSGLLASELAAGLRAAASVILHSATHAEIGGGA